ncbi:MAG TPA: tetratricopeptide repeat protein, partial [Armatimonadota bacterium]|nr:tetratricopeptide repeat protein [Armatimonadota bacterium]
KYGIFAEPALVPEMPWKLDAVRRASRQRYADAIDAATRGRDLDGAIKLLHEALECDPDYTDARFRLGRCYLRQDRFEEAIAEFEKVLAIDPSYASAARQMEIAKQEIKKRDASQNTTNTAPDDQDTVN